MSDEMKAATLDQLGLNRGVADAVKILSGAGDQIRIFEDQLRDAGGTTEEVADKQLNSLQGQTEELFKTEPAKSFLYKDCSIPISVSNSADV